MKTLIAHPRFDSLVDELVARNPEALCKGRVDFQKFWDGTPNLHLHDVKEGIEHQDVTYIGDFSRVEEFFEQYAVIRSIVDYYADKIRVIIPYFPVGTMERISKKWEVATARYFADLLSHIPPGRSGKPSLHTFDIHALVERFLFDPFRVNVELHTALSLLELDPHVVIAFPDDGASKRFGESFPEHKERIICIKVRGRGDRRMITVKEWDPRGKDIIIIDDLIQTGSTIREAAELFRSLWARSVLAFAPHWVFPHDSHIELAKHLDELIVTDSIPANIERARSVANMQVLSIAPLVEKILRVG